jgi:ribonuclease HI
MKQLNLFEECITSSSVVKPHKKDVHWKLFIDGASRKNPGHAGAGIYLLKDDDQIYKKGFYLGVKTNNQAEYLALLLGVFYAKKHIGRDDTLYIFSDSELLVKHMKGEYKIKSLELKKLFDVAFIILDQMQYTFCHILREYNGVADELANAGIDKKIKVPQEFITFIAHYDLSL